MAKYDYIAITANADLGKTDARIEIRVIYEDGDVVENINDAVLAEVDRVVKVAEGDAPSSVSGFDP